MNRDWGSYRGMDQRGDRCDSLNQHASSSWRHSLLRALSEQSMRCAGQRKGPPREKMMRKVFRPPRLVGRMPPPPPRLSSILQGILRGMLEGRR